MSNNTTSISIPSAANKTAPSTTFNNLRASCPSCERTEMQNENTNDTCKYCGEVLSRCEVREHWERRLKAVRLSEDRAERPRIVIRNEDGETWQDRYVQMDRNPDTIVSRPVAIPMDEEVAQLFVADSMGVRLSTPKATRFWPNAETPNRAIEYSTYRMGRTR